MRLTYSALQQALRKAEEKMINGNWSRANCAAYLGYFGMNTEIINTITERSENRRLYNLAEKNRREDPQGFYDMVEMASYNEDGFMPVPFPALWVRGVSLQQHIDVLMHLVFLGAVDGAIKFVHQWLKMHNKYANFMRLAEKRLDGVKKLNLHWCKAMPYKGKKLGGWVSENYLAFARICKWFYLIGDNLDDDSTFVEPNKPQEKWKVKDN
jgi:hypothetical protein